CFGTSEEKLLIKFIDKAYEKLKPKFDKIYLVRNERHFKLYNFDDGRPTEPDFVLFMVNHQPEENILYQIFIEPKGEPFLKPDEWKEKFLMQLKEEHNLEQIWEGKKYIIYGMPFFNHAKRITQFEQAFNEIINS